MNEVDLTVRQGEIVGLLGPNGAGKTTTFYMMVGLIPPYSGTVHLDGDDLTSTAMYRRARLGIGYLGQEPSVFRRLTVEENVLAILETLKLPKGSIYFEAENPRDIQQIVRGLKDRNIGVIITDHNVEQTLEIVDRAYIMYEGCIRVSGTVSELVWNEEVAEIYLGPTLTARMRARYPEPVGV